MRHQHIDLNLLPVLEALLAEHHVSRAAARVGLTQSAMSRALARLRDQLGDPLFVRTGSGMRPTTRATAIAGRLHLALAALDDAIAVTPAFDPATSRRTFRIATADYGSAVVLPALLGELARVAPGVELVVVPAGDATITALESGELDAAVTPRRKGPVGMIWRKLFDEHFVCVARRGHPRIGARLTLDTYCSLSHVVVTTGGSGGLPIDDLLARRGRVRHVGLRVPSFLAAPLVVAGSDAITTTPERIARVFADRFDLRIHRAPLPIPGFTMMLGWHERARTDPGHAWLRALIART